MPLTMQAAELAPGDQYVVRRGAFLGRPDRAGGDGGADAFDRVAEVAAGQLGLEPGSVQRGGVGGNVDQDSLEPLGVGMAELELAQLLEVIVQQPGVVERRLEDQRLAPRHRGAVAAVHGARRKLLADDDVGRRPAGLRARESAAAAFPWRPVAPLPGIALATGLTDPLPAPRLAPLLARPLRRREERRRAAAGILAVITADGLVADRVRHLADACFQRGAALRRVELVPFGLARPQHGGKRLGRVNDLGDRLAPGRADEIV